MTVPIFLPIAALAASLASLAVGILLVLLVLRGLWCELAWQRFANKTQGLPLLANPRHVLGNHLRSFVCAPDNGALVRRAHQELGATFGWMAGTSRAASTIDPGVIKKIFQDESREHVNRLRLALPSLSATFPGPDLMWTKDDQWRKIRGMIEPALRDLSVQAPHVVGRLESSANKLAGLLEQHLGAGQQVLVSLDDLVHRFTLDALLDCLHDQTDQIDFDHEPNPWIGHVNGTRCISTESFPFRLAVAFPQLAELWCALTKHLRPRPYIHGRFLDLMDSQIRQRLRCRAEGALENANFIDSLTDRHLDHELTKREYVGCLGSLLGAVDVSTRDCLIYTLYQLAMHQDVQDKLRESIGQRGLESIYLSWVVKESLRLRPPVPFGCSRVIKRDIRLDSGHKIPPGTSLSVSIYALHRSELLWGSDADKFRPERWNEATKHHPCQYLPFGTGDRQCPGRTFALAEMNVLLKTLLCRYEFEAKLKPDVDKFESPFGHHMVPNSPTYLTIKRH